MQSPRLETAVNLCLIATCIVVSAAAGKRLLTKESAGATPGNILGRPTGYAQGDVLPTLEGIRYAEREKTMLLVLSSHCPFCTESMPFYSRIASSRHDGRLQIVVLGSESQTVLADYVTSHGLRVDQVRTLQPGVLKVVATPTIILADSAGRVMAQWRGVLRHREAEVEDVLSR